MLKPSAASTIDWTGSSVTVDTASSVTVDTADISGKSVATNQKGALLVEVALIGRVYGTLLFAPPDTPVVAEMIGLLGDSSSPELLKEEYQRLFIGPNHLDAPAWGSVYLDRDNVLFGSSTFELRSWLHWQGITIRNERREPEDQIGKMLLLMAWLAEEKPHLLAEYLSAHLMPWAPRYLDLLEANASLPLYKRIARDLRDSLADIMERLGIQAVRKRLYF